MASEPGNTRQSTQSGVGPISFSTLHPPSSSCTSTRQRRLGCGLSYTSIILILLLILVNAQRLPFFVVRLALAGLSTVCEARFYRSIADNVSLRIGRYTLFFLIFNAGMYTSATSTFTQPHRSLLGWDKANIRFQPFSLRASLCTSLCWLSASLWSQSLRIDCQR